jgi:hypothetical protein
MFTVTLRVVRGNEKGTPISGGMTGLTGGCKYGHLTLQAWRISNLRQENMVVSPAGFGPMRPSSNCKLLIRLLVREGTHMKKFATV